MTTSLYNQYRVQIRFLASIVIIINIIFLFKIFTVQILNHDKYIQSLNEETVKILKKKGHRGKIIDRNNEVLADNMQKFDFWVNTAENFDTLKIVSIFSETFNKPKQYYLDLLSDKTPYKFIEENIEKFYCKNILLSIGEINGLNYTRSEERFYPYDNLASNIIGEFNSGQATSGIEYLFDEVLSGDEANVKHRKLDNGEIEYNDTLIAPGEDIVLTIDLELQAILENELKKGVRKSQAVSGNGLIVNPYTGEILAMASLSNSNPNKHNHNLNFYRNTTISNSYEPGSTFKIVALAAALDSSLITLKDSINCENGKFILKNGHLLHDHEPRGQLSISDVFAYSSNIGMAKISDLLTDQQLYNKSRDFGFGSKTGILLPDEQSGILRHFNEWSYQSSKSIAIGQEISCTSLQLAMAYSSIANGGYLLDPIIIKSIGNTNLSSNNNRVIRKVLTYETSRILIDLLRMVVSKGSGSNAYISGYDVAGKTGTAQKFIDGSYSNTEYISSFASIFPADSPKYVCIISVDSPDKSNGKHWGNVTAAPIVKNIYKKIINLENMESDSWANSENIDINQNLINDDYMNLDVIPDFKGKTLKQAIKASNKIGIEVDPSGFLGLVVWQSIEPGSIINKKDICKLKIGN